MDRLSPLIPHFSRGSSRSQSPKPSVENYDYDAHFHDEYVRVCRLIPGAKEQPLECELIEVPIHGCPVTYESLSLYLGRSNTDSRYHL